MSPPSAVMTLATTISAVARSTPPAANTPVTLLRRGGRLMLAVLILAGGGVEPAGVFRAAVELLHKSLFVLFGAVHARTGFVVGRGCFLVVRHGSLLGRLRGERRNRLHNIVDATQRKVRRFRRY